MALRGQPEQCILEWRGGRFVSAHMTLTSRRVTQIAGIYFYRLHDLPPDLGARASDDATEDVEIAFSTHYEKNMGDADGIVVDLVKICFFAGRPDLQDACVAREVRSLSMRRPCA